MGGCHGIPGRGEYTPLTEDQNAILVSATLSSLGAGFSSPGCLAGGAGCGITAVLAADAARQFATLTNGIDPVVSFALRNGQSLRQAESAAAGLNILTGVFSLGASYKAILQNSYSLTSAGALGAISTDTLGSANTLIQLGSSFKHQNE